MTKLPVTIVEHEVLAFGRDWLAIARGYGLGDPFNSDSMHAHVRRMCRDLADLHERNAARLVELALAGAEDVAEGLKDLIAERNKDALPLGPALATYVNIITDRPPAYRRPRSRPRENFLAAFVTVGLLIALMLHFSDLRLRRNPASKRQRPSACSVVAQVLREAGVGFGGEERVRKIWERYGPPVVPGYGWNPKK
jgi:hypothetical protein